MTRERRKADALEKKILFLGCSFPVRYTQILLLFTSLVLTLHQRTNVPEVIVVLTAANGTYAHFMPEVCKRNL